MARVPEAVCGVIASVALAGCSAGTTTAPSVTGHARIVPWLAATRRIPSQLWPPQGPLDAPRCTTGDLGHTVVYYQGATGNWLGGVRFENVGTHPCTVSGTPALTLFTRSGARIGAPIRRNREVGLENGLPPWSGFPVVSLRQGQTADAVWEVPDLCGGPAVATMVFRLPNATLRAHVPGEHLRVRCRGHGLLGVDRLSPGSPPPRPPSPIPLTIHLTTPLVVKRGTTMDSVLTLGNPGRTAYRFGRCPTYWQGFSTAKQNEVTVTRGWLLNCRVMPTIPAGGSSSYRMRVAIPRNAKTRLDWSFEPVPDTPGPGSATAAVRFR